MNRLLIIASALLLFGSAQAVDFYSGSFSQPSHKVIGSFQQRFAKLDHNSSDFGANKYQSSSEAVAYVYNNGGLTAGAALSYEYGTNKIDFVNRSGTRFDGKGKIRDETLGLNVFGTYQTMDGWYGSGSAFVGFNQSKPRYLYSYTPAGGRNNFVGRDTERDTYFASSVEAGKIFDLGGFFLKPHVGVDYAYVPGVRYDYIDGGNWSALSAGSQNYLEIPVGVGIGKTFDAGCWTVTPNLDLVLVNAIGKMDNKNFNSGFSTFDGNRWRTYGVAGSHTGGRINAGLDASFNNRFDVGLDYTYEVRKDYYDHRLSALLGVNF